MTRSTLAALLTLALCSCSGGTLVGPLPASPGGGTAAPPATGPADLASLPAHCTARGSGLQVLPDPACTPGAIDPRVTQDDLGTTVCRSGYTRTVRPPTSYTEPLKRELMLRYGDTGPLGAYELDHLISLELGGNPTSVANLWPEPGASPNPKDQVELAANRAVCSGRMTLADAQRAIATDWVQLGRRLGAT
ncbi:MAG TPA: hypothetical protein VKF59_11030 [Candidatus Dormibacteraeota bacterium]|nr:hypothetical protein [Candidatus Dormibacteraeota bacterium]